MKRGQSGAHIIPLRRGKLMNPIHLDDFPQDVQDTVYEIIAKALERYEQEQEEAS